MFVAVAMLLAVLLAAYTAIRFPYTCRSMEGDALWLFTWDFWRLKLSTPPALTLWLTDYLLQWFATPAVGATLISLPLFLAALCAHAWLLRLFPMRQVCGWLALLPVVVVGYWCTLELHMALELLFLFALLAVHARLRNAIVRLVFSFLVLPVGYTLMSMPMLGIMLAGMMLAEWRVYSSRNWRVQVLGFAVLYLIPIAYSANVTFVPFGKRYTTFSTYFKPLHSQEVAEMERLRSYIILGSENRWEELLYAHHCQAAAQRGDGLALRFALLAESELGTLPQNIQYYPIMQEESFLFPHEREYATTQFNRLFYGCLGVYDEAFHQAQEFGLLQFNGICFQSLRQMVEYSIREGEWEVAEKYLGVLARSSRHGKFIAEKRKEMEQARSTFKRDIPLRADNFVGGYPLPYEMLRLCRYYNERSPRCKKMLDYALCSFLLRGDRNSFRQIVAWHGFYNEQNLPDVYRAFLKE